MKARIYFDWNLNNKFEFKTLNLDIIPRVGDTIDLDIFLSDTQIEELESYKWDNNSGAEYAEVKSVALRKDETGDLYYSLYLGAESD